MIDDYVGGYSPIEQENIELEYQVDRLTEENEQLKLQAEKLKETNKQLEQEKCKLLGIIQKKDKLIQRMKTCYNCESYIDDDAYDICKTCYKYSKWRLADD